MSKSQAEGSDKARGDKSRGDPEIWAIRVHYLAADWMKKFVVSRAKQFLYGKENAVGQASRLSRTSPKPTPQAKPIMEDKPETLFCLGHRGFSMNP